MAIEDMFQALEAQADEQCREVEAEAEARVDAILRDAEAEAARIRQRMLDEAEASATAKAAQAVNAAKLANKKDAAALRGGAVESVFGLATDRLAGVRSDSAYVDLFRTLLDQAVQCAGDGECEVLVDPSDADLATKAVDAMARNGMAVRTDIETSGGVVVTTDAGRVMHRNTLESRLDKARGAAQARVAGILFD
jgi:vacuolar-type H+-ATPase subunit E/Vma4